MQTLAPTTRLNRDMLRQVSNLVSILIVISVTLLGYVLGSNSNFTSTDTGTPPIVPAGYAFIVWAFIYLGALVYCVYQALARHREDPLLRRIGFFTASTYLATAFWLLFAQLNWYWLTVACFVWILGSLVAAFIPLISAEANLSWARRLIIVLPIGVFLGWTTVALIANIATALGSATYSSPTKTGLSSCCCLEPSLPSL
jgi:hypothetical protein